MQSGVQVLRQEGRGGAEGKGEMGTVTVRMESVNKERGQYGRCDKQQQQQHVTKLRRVAKAQTKGQAQRTTAQGLV